MVDNFSSSLPIKLNFIINVFGREIRMPYEIVKEGLEENSKNWEEHAMKIRDRLHRADHVARKHLAINTTRIKDYYDLKSNLPNFPLSTNFIHFGF
jgi:hypothetical protein